ncbi:hypothetical protein E3O42_17645 [Cryobacterium adonitolivorans]|uniref:Flagellar hook-length control protein-like C-terminal domain-containing protein n=1 Tax=Cryobacterium adonitolivorans TaxID=1259189 RepID=A0A4R8VZ33_9MICO|nr:flagellar hook-length control protein FliK [Cryobacterium adonitolivorans]TFB95969.1 hypothetical protein E3O42_17645 [Cryobacterium adonitolivorans]
MPAGDAAPSHAALTDAALTDTELTDAELPDKPRGSAPDAFVPAGPVPGASAPVTPRQPGSESATTLVPVADPAAAVAGGVPAGTTSDAESGADPGTVTIEPGDVGLASGAGLASSMAQPMAQEVAQASAQSGAPVWTALTGTAQTGPASPAASGSADADLAVTGTAATGPALMGTGTGATGVVASGVAAAGTVATGTVATGTVATGTVATGTVATGTVATGTGATGTVAAGTRATGTVAAGTRATGTVATGTGAAGAVANGTAAAWTAVDGAASVVWSTRSHGADTGEPAGAESPSAGLVPQASSGPVASLPVTGSPAGALAAAPSTVPAVPVPLASQVARPLFTLAAAGPGEHTMSISVTPDDLGPVLVRARISAAGIRLELFAPTDAARDALRLILPDLRRDLSVGALPASLDVSARSQPGDAGSSGRQDRPTADQPGQGNAALGGDPRGANDRRRESGASDQWLRSPAIDADAAAANAVVDPARPDQTRGRVDVLA